MTRAELRTKDIDIIIHPMLIGISDSEKKKMYSYSIFDNEEEIGSLEENPEFSTYEAAEEWAVEAANEWVQAQQN